MKQVRKFLPMTLLGMWLALGAGCTGINASHSVSPASFFLPGLIQVEPEEPVLPTDPKADPDREPVQVAVHLLKDLRIR